MFSPFGRIEDYTHRIAQNRWDVKRDSAGKRLYQRTDYAIINSYQYTDRNAGGIL